MPRASPDDAVNAKCPNNKPHKCPPHSTCYGSWEYCSTASKSAEPCVSETVLENIDSLKKLCSDIAQGVNVTKQIKHPSCNVEADCRAQFTALFVQPSTQKDETPWTYIYILAPVCVLLLIVLAVICIKYIRNKAQKKRLQKEQLNEIVFLNNNEVNILQNNRINESRQENNQRQQSTDHEPGDMDDTEETSLMRRDTREATNAQNSPDSGFTPDSTEVTINTDSSSGSGSASNRNSSHSSHNSSASIGSVVQEENLHRSTSWGTHPADRENSHLRALHMPSSEPLDSTQLVTNQTTYNQTNNRGLE